MSKHRIVADIDGATLAELKANPRCEIKTCVEIVENPYVGCRTVLEHLDVLCREKDDEIFTRAEAVRACEDTFTAAQVDYALGKMVDDYEIRRVRFGIYDLGLCLYGMDKAA